MRFKAAALLVFSFALLSGCGKPNSQTHGSTVRIALGSQIEFMNLPVTLAQQLGFFQEEHLQVTIAGTGSGSKSLEALLGGSADVVIGSHDHAVQMAAEGKSVKSFVTIMRYPGSVVILSPKGAKKIHRVEDMKGATAGVTSPGSSFHFLLNYLLIQHGLSPSDLNIVSLGGNASRVAAIARSKVDLGVLLEPGVTELLTLSPESVILADTRNIEGVRRIFNSDSYPSAVVYATERWLREDSEPARHMARAIRRALQWIQGHSPEEIGETIPAELRGGDSRFYIQALRGSLATFSPDGLMSRQGAEAVRKVLAVSIAKVRNASFDITATYTNDYLQNERVSSIQ